MRNDLAQNERRLVRKQNWMHGNIEVAPTGIYENERSAKALFLRALLEKDQSLDEMD